ncbi:DUF4199 domain-containing protein [Gilvibacter sediminis]|uniref:DUF4199 domain-containing protein n=1 Tax=Gilvibacter sediminis TaxID=379071 RepID=UPI0023500AC4|nr:DUF4199 domain-containing protein [Gilvibacter sediminis]MDC7996570.1 DUF4199 domain-containing protein [Gilvibacter sediminis]
MKSTIIKYGIRSLIAGLILFGISLLLSLQFEIGNSEILGYAGIIIALSMIYFGIKAYRDRVNGGAVSFGNALLVGLGISAMGSLGIAVADMIYTGIIDPDWAVNYAEEMKAQGVEAEVYSTPMLGVLMFFIAMFVGMIITLISALILKRKA